MDYDSRKERVHDVLGFETPLKDFFHRLSTVDREAFWQSVADRIKFIDALCQEVTLEYDQRVYGYKYQALIDFQIRALELYLLCTCLDAIANDRAGKRALSYVDWLANKGRKAESEKRDELVTLILTELDQDNISKETLINVSQRLYKFYSEEYGGLGHNFHELFQSIPVSVQQYLADTYLISDDPADPVRNDLITKNWLSMPANERLRMISDYLWKYRRNEYTHGIRARPPTSPWHPYWDNSDPPKIVKWVLCKGWEPWVIRDLIVTLCQIDLGYSRDKDFLERSYRYRQRQQILWQILTTLRRNRSLLPGYLTMLKTQQPRDMMSIFYYGPLPLLETEVIEAALRTQLVDRTQVGYEKGFADWLEQYTIAVKQLNSTIEDFNEAHPHGNAHEARRLAAIDFINELIAEWDYRQYVNGKQTELFSGNVPHILIKPVPSDSSWAQPSE